MAQVVVVENVFDVFDKVEVDDIEDYVNKHKQEKKAEKEAMKNGKLVEQDNKLIVHHKPKLDDHVNSNTRKKSRNHRRKKNYNLESEPVPTDAALDDANRGRGPSGQDNGYRRDGTDQNNQQFVYVEKRSHDGSAVSQRNAVGPKQFRNVNNGGCRFYKDFSSRDPGYVSDNVRGNGGSHDDGRVYCGGHDDGRAYRGGHDGGRAYRGGHDDGRAYWGVHDGGRAYRGVHDGGRAYRCGHEGGRAYHGGHEGGRSNHGDHEGGRGNRGGHEGSRGNRGSGYAADGRGNHGGNNTEGGNIEYQRVDRNGDGGKSVDANHPANADSESANSGAAKGNNSPRKNWVDNRASSTDSRPPPSEEELERRKKWREELEWDAKLMTLAQYEKILENKKKELQEKLSGGCDKKIEQKQANEKQDYKNAFQKKSYQENNKNTSQKMARVVVRLQGIGAASYRDKYRRMNDETNKKGDSDSQTEDGQVKVPQIHEFPVLCRTVTTPTSSKQEKRA